MQYVVARQQLKGNPLVYLRDNTDNFSIVYSNIYANKQQKWR